MRQDIKTKLILALTCMVVALFATPLWAANPSAKTTPPKDEEQDRSLKELNKELSNPVSSVWSISFQQNNYVLEIDGKKDHWKANSAGDVWTVPIGIGIGKLVKLGPLPVKIGLAVQYMVHHPDNFGQKWNIQLGVTPVIPNFIKGTLFD
jgi:hypothetical protein